MRARISVVPPGGYGTTHLIERVGYVSAAQATVLAISGVNATPKAQMRKSFAAAFILIGLKPDFFDELLAATSFHKNCGSIVTGPCYQLTYTKLTTTIFTFKLKVETFDTTIFEKIP